MQNNPLLRIVRRRKMITSYRKERTMAEYLGMFGLREDRVNKKGVKYPTLNITKELELVYFLRNNFGFGAYTVLAHKKRLNGSYIFWKGEISENGWIFTFKETLSGDDKKDINMFQKQLYEAATPEEEQEIKTEIETTKQFAKELSSMRRYGFYPYLIPSGKRGQINFWDTPSLLEQPQRIEIPSFYAPVKINKRSIIPKKKHPNMSVDEINGNFREL